MPVNAQTYAIPEARQLVDSLHAAEVLSDYGREMLGREISTGNHFPVYTPGRIHLPDRQDTLSAAQLLGALHAIYQEAYVYRRGMTAEQEVLERWQRRPGFNMDMVRTPAFLTAVEQRRRGIPGYRFEQGVVEAAQTDTNVVWAQWTDAWTVMDGTVNDTLVPANRSVFGPEVRETLRAVFDVGLIPQDTFDLYQQELEAEGIYPDYLLLARLAEAAGMRETEEQRMRDRRSAIQFLGERGLLPSDSQSALLEDTTLLRTLDDRALYAYIQPQITLHLTEPSGPEDLARQLWRQLCEYDAELCDLRLELVEDTDDTTDAYTRYWLVGKRGTWRSERSTEIYTYPGSEETPWYQVYSADVFFQPFNAYLASVNAPYRFFNLPMDPTGSETAGVKLPVFPLGSAAARSVGAPRLRDAMDYLRGPETETFVSRQEADFVLDTLEKLGYLAPLDQSEIAAARSCLEAGTLGGLPDLFRCLPGLYATDSRAAELGDLPGSIYVLPATAYDRQDVYVKLEQPVVDFLSERFPFGLYPVK